MKPRTLIFNTRDIAVNEQDVAESINLACRRGETNYKISGLCQSGDIVFLPMEENQHNHNVEYILAPFSGTSKECIEADIFTRWGSGFTTKGMIRLSETYMGLFESITD